MADSSALHCRVEQLQAELASESTSIANLRQNVTAAAQQEAQTLAQLQSQVGHWHTPLASSWLKLVGPCYAVVLAVAQGGCHQFAEQQDYVSSDGKMALPSCRNY